MTKDFRCSQLQSKGKGGEKGQKNRLHDSTVQGKDKRKEGT